jgi:hypothetical protein
VALQESHGLDAEALSAWCREHGLFAHHLTQWRDDFCRHSTVKSPPQSSQELRQLKTAHQKLQRELLRKDKALVEAAALLILQKKFQALLGGEEE